ncbi:MAG: hypothetical protein AABY49_10600 [Planctomycetota bacterium]
MSIFKNAIDSIILGIEDYNTAEPRRLLSATRNLVSGILLLIKHKLSTLSPAGTDEALIKQRVLPQLDGSGGVLWKGKGKKTVDVHQMRERCEGLRVSVDWRRVQKVVDHRNEIEHYFPSLNQNALRTLIADSFIIIRDLLRTQLNEDPLTCLGAETWNTLTDVANVYEKEKKECEANFDSVDWAYQQLQDALTEWQCPKCSSGLIDIVNPGSEKWSARFQCRSCGRECDFEEAAEKAVEDFFSTQNYLSVKDGGEPGTVLCPNCGHETYDLQEDCCLMCEESVERECQRCGMEIPASEIDGSGYCSWCNHMMSKDE